MHTLWLSLSHSQCFFHSHLLYSLTAMLFESNSNRAHACQRVCVWSLHLSLNMNTSEPSLYQSLQMFDWWVYYSRLRFPCVYLWGWKALTCWLQSSPRCPSGRLAVESLDWMSGSTHTTECEDMRRENIIDFYKARSLFSHKCYGSFRPCVYMCVCSGRI